MIPPRIIVMNLLTRMDTGGSYSNIILDNTLSNENLNNRDRSFATALFYGVLERRMTLDYLIRYYSKIEFDNISPKGVVILRMGFYQLLYMDSVPDNAAVNESVKLCDREMAGFVNAILRNFIRDNKKINLTRLSDESKLAVEYSCPKWIIKRWIKAYGEGATVKILESCLGRPPLYLRVNLLKATVPEVINELKQDGVNAVVNPHLDTCLELQKLDTGKSIVETSAFRKGLFHVQDISSQLCCKIIRPVFHETVIDVCAAPGGKTFTLSQYMGNTGRIIACDLYDGKLSLLTESAKRLGINIISVMQNDSTVFNEKMPQGDKVLCDVPCSGLGVMRRKPEIKYKPYQSIEELPIEQGKILSASSRYVKPGGSLFYSTCTLNPSENEEVVEKFLKDNPDFAPVIMPIGIREVEGTANRNFFPHITGGDGFFVSTLRRIR